MRKDNLFDTLWSDANVSIIKHWGVTRGYLEYTVTFCSVIIHRVHLLSRTCYQNLIRHHKISLGVFSFERIGKNVQLVMTMLWCMENYFIYLYDVLLVFHVLCTTTTTYAMNVFVVAETGKQPFISPGDNTRCNYMALHVSQYYGYLLYYLYSGNTWLCVHCQWTHNQVFLLLSHMLM